MLSVFAEVSAFIAGAICSAGGELRVTNGLDKPSSVALIRGLLRHGGRLHRI